MTKTTTLVTFCCSLSSRMLKSILLCTCLAALSPWLTAQVVLNEACPKNVTGLVDEEGETVDWVELYNAGNASQNLKGYGLSDDDADLYQWTFPDVEIGAQDHLLVFASGKDKFLKFNHWETAVFAGDTWRYKVPSSSMPSSWVELSYDDSSWLQGKGGFGYGDGDDNTKISNPSVSVYLRKTFTVTDTSNIAAAVLHMDYDDGFVAYLNGTEIARANLGIKGSMPAYNETALSAHEAVLYEGIAPEKFIIEKSRLNGILENGVNVLSVQVHNATAISSDLTAKPYFSFAIKGAEGDYNTPPAWFNLSASQLHANFKLSSDGEEVLLTDPSGNVADILSFDEMKNDHSAGRSPDGSDNTYVFTDPTPGSTNNNATAYDWYVGAPQFSYEGGFHSSSLSVELSQGFPVGNEIRYTTDGSPPDASSALYASPISVDTTTVIRAIAFGGNSELPSKIATNTYIINEHSTLPVISISTDPFNLWDYYEGIYVMGPNAQEEKPHYGANYHKNWEIPVHIEYYSPEGELQFEQGFGGKIHGGWSRAKPQKSMRFLAKGEYGNRTLDYKLFPDKDIFSFKRFVMRNSGTDNNDVHFRDALMQKAVKGKTNNYIQEYQPCVAFINGRYWGVYNLREKTGRFYFEENLGADPDKVDLLEFDGNVIHGDNGHYNYMIDFIMNNNMADPDEYAEAQELLDVENLIDVFICHTYYVNEDWPQNNLKFWREDKPGEKWRYVLIDTDFGLGLFHGPHNNDLERVLTQTGNNIHVPMFNKLLKNAEFRTLFINRYADLMNTVLHKKNLKALAYKLKDSIAPEMGKHFQRWSGGSFSDWENDEIPDMIEWIEERPPYARAHVEQYFNLNKQVDISLDVYPPEAGKIQISTIIPDSFPWEGIYFDGVPVELKAFPNPGFEFQYWQSDNLVKAPDSNTSLTLNLSTDDNFTAYFTGAAETPKVTFSEINYNSSASMDGGEWVELYNYGNIEVDLSGWLFRDKSLANSFTIPEGTVLGKNEYLVLCNDTAKFSTLYSNVNNVMGPFDFNLSNNGETINLYDSFDELHVSAGYDNAPPWPQEANGEGKTLELLDPEGDMKHHYNWFAGCYGGSPGGPYKTPCLLTTEEEHEDNEIALKNYPNPFDGSTTILYSINKKQQVSLKLYDMFGRSVANIKEGMASAGEHKLVFNGNNLPTGVYYCILKTEQQQEVRVLQVIR